jgi:hypothetical protein
VLPRRLLACSIPAGVLVAALLFTGLASADPIPDGAAPSPDAPVAKAEAPVKAEAPSKKAEAPSKAEAPVKAEAPIKVDAASLKAQASSRTRTAARAPARCSTGRRATKASGAGCADPGAVDGVPVRKVGSGPHLEVVARDLRLDATSSERLARIAQRYFEATRRRLVITGGTRTPERQAELMLEKLAHGDDLVALYENKAAVTEIRNLYRDSAGARQPRKQIIRAVRDVILAQMERGIYVSRHLKAGAAHVRSRDFKAAQEAAFRAAVEAEPGVVLVDERSSAEPHLHLGL